MAGDTSIPARLHAGCVFGGIGELAQALLTTTRNAEWDDLAIDALGATIGLGLVAFTEPAGRLPSRFRVRLVWPAILLASGAFALPLVELAMNYWYRQQQLPDLLTGDSVGAKDFVRGSEADLSYTSTPNIELPGTRFVLTVVPHPHATWPGIAIEEPWPDWSGYRALEVSITNPNPIELALNIRIEDAHHNQQFTDRFNHPIALSPGQNLKLLISTDQIQQGPVQRELDLQHIARVIVFEKGGPHAHPFIVRHLRLVN